MKWLFILMMVGSQLFALDPLTIMKKCETQEIKDGNPKVCIEAAKLYEKQKHLTVDEKYNLGAAYYNAGVIYMFGKRHTNYSKAARMFQNAIDVGFCFDGNCGAKQDLGLLYFYGLGVAENKVKGCNLMKNAMEHNVDKAKQAYQKFCE
jgi:TPR repeat protein